MRLMGWGSIIRANLENIKKLTLDRCESISRAAQYLRSQGQIGQKTIWEGGNIDEVKDALLMEAEKTSLSERDDKEWELLHRNYDTTAMKRFSSQDTRNPKESKHIHYGSAAELDYLKFGSDESVEYKNDPILIAFQVGFFLDGRRSPSQKTLTEEDQNIIPHKDLEVWLEQQGIKLKHSVAPIAGTLEELAKEIERIIKEDLTEKQIEVLIPLIIEGKSFGEVAKALNVTKKAIYERLHGNEKGGGAIKKLRRNEKLQKIARKLGFSLHDLPDCSY